MPRVTRGIGGALFAGCIVATWMGACGGGTIAPECREGEVECEGDCVRADDPRHCGGCGLACADGLSCQEGTCVLACGGGTVSCEGSCVDLGVDFENCGACGNVCPEGRLCLWGHCVVACGDEATACEGRCVDTAIDPQNCGGCGNACAEGEACIGGACAVGCGKGTIACGVGCVDPETDPGHCGGCDQACAAGEACIEGSCGAACGSGMQVCGGVCVDTSSDAAHCGGCNQPCPGPSGFGAAVCEQGVCGIACDPGAVAVGAECFACGPGALLADGPVAYWRLGDAKNPTAVDISGQSNHLTYSGASLNAAGIASDGDKAITFNNAGHIVGQVSGFPTTEISVELWVKTDANNQGTLFSYATSAQNNSFLIIDTRNLSIAVHRGGALATNIAVDDGQWHHVVATWASATGVYQVYVDGVLGFMDVQSQGIVFSSSGYAALGNDQDCLGGCFDDAQGLRGSLDEVVVYDRVLTADEVARHAKAVTCTP